MIDLGIMALKILGTFAFAGFFGCAVGLVYVYFYDDEDPE
jgi:hypothetical protein